MVVHSRLHLWPFSPNWVWLLRVDDESSRVQSMEEEKKEKLFWWKTLKSFEINDYPITFKCSKFLASDCRRRRKQIQKNYENVKNIRVHIFLFRDIFSLHPTTLPLRQFHLFTPSKLFGPENTRHKGEVSLYLRSVSSLTGLNLVALVHTNRWQHIFFFGWIQSGQTGDSTYVQWYFNLQSKLEFSVWTLPDTGTERERGR